MSKHQQWKMLYLLYNCAYRKGRRRILTEEELTSAGVWCDPDSREILENNSIVFRKNNEYELSKQTRTLLSILTFSIGPETNKDMVIDYPRIFVVMPFSQSWSERVFADLYEASARDAELDITKGDNVVRFGDLGTNVWRNIMQAGLIVADVSIPNPNVYYEIGLADALGKRVFIFKQRDVVLPADFGGSHYYTYDVEDLAAARTMLTGALKMWATERDVRASGVKALVDRSGPSLN